MKNRKIDLLQPVDFNGQTVTHVMLREPQAAEYLQLGEVYISSTSETGQVVSAEDSVKIGEYLALLIVEPAGLPLDRVALADGMRLKDAVLDFFVDAHRAGLKAAQTALSATSDGSMQMGSAAQP